MYLYSIFDWKVSKIYPRRLVLEGHYELSVYKIHKDLQDLLRMVFYQGISKHSNKFASFVQGYIFSTLNWSPT